MVKLLALVSAQKQRYKGHKSKEDNSILHRYGTWVQRLRAKHSRYKSRNNSKMSSKTLQHQMLHLSSVTRDRRAARLVSCCVV